MRCFCASFVERKSAKELLALVGLSNYAFRDFNRGVDALSCRNFSELNGSISKRDVDGWPCGLCDGKDGG